MHSLSASEVDKFYDYSLSDFHSESTGDVNGPGWFALFRRERVILQQDSNGFKYASKADNKAELDEAWDSITEECKNYEMPDDEIGCTEYYGCHPDCNCHDILEYDPWSYKSEDFQPS